MTESSIHFKSRTLGTCVALAGFVATLASAALPVQAADTLKEAFTDGTIIFNARGRYEHVNQDGFDQNAKAITVRVRAGFETAEFNHVKALIEVEHVEALNSSYNNTRNGVDRPTIADPQATELNRAQISFTGIPSSTITVGRQRINLGNQRYVGAVGWRQNEQTFDAIRMDNNSIKDVAATYIYMFNVNRVFGENHPTPNMDNLHLDGHIVNASYSGLSFGTVLGYFLSLDFDDAPGLSTRTFGLRFSGTQSLGENVKINYAAEYAHQSDFADNPLDYGVDYYVLEGGLSAAGFKGTVGYEVLGGSDVAGFATPLATLHKWQGWADVFLGTPAVGIEDFYASIAYNNADIMKGLNATIVYHDFSSDKAFGSLGHEIDLAVNVKVHDMLTLGLKYADYSGAGFADDRTKIWFSMTSAL